MKFLNPFLFTNLALGLNHVADIDEDAMHAKAHGIFSSILNNREFGSTLVKFSEWQDPSGDIYVVPSINAVEESPTAAYGLGYKFINDDNSVVSSLDISNVQKIVEENITAAGFPFGWKKHEEKTADDFFPFGSKKFMMIGVNKESIGMGNSNEMPLDKDEFADENENDPYRDIVTNHGLFHWKEEEDDCNADEKTNKLFDTDHFFFVGVGSIDMQQPNLYKREDSKTTVTVTVTEPGSILTLTETYHPSGTHKYVWYHPEPTDSYDDDDEYEYTETLTTTTHIPFHFTSFETETPETVEDSDESETTTFIESTVTETSDYYTSEIKTTSKALSTTTNLKTPSDISTESAEEFEMSETWDLSTLIITESSSVEDTTTSIPLYSNSSLKAGSSNAFSIYTSNFYGNKSSSSTIDKADDTIYTRTVIGNASKFTTAENIGNIEDGYWASLLALMFAVVSGIILI